MKLWREWWRGIAKGKIGEKIQRLGLVGRRHAQRPPSPKKKKQSDVDMLYICVFMLRLVLSFSDEGPQTYTGLAI